MCSVDSGVGPEHGAMPDRANSFQRTNNFGRHASELMPFGFKPDFMHHWNLPQAYNPYAASCSRVPGSVSTFERLPTYGEESTGSHEVISKEESSNSPTTDRLVLLSQFLNSVVLLDVHVQFVNVVLNVFLLLWTTCSIFNFKLTVEVSADNVFSSVFIALQTEVDILQRQWKSFCINECHHRVIWGKTVDAVHVAIWLINCETCSARPIVSKQ